MPFLCDSTQSFDSLFCLSVRSDLRGIDLGLERAEELKGFLLVG